MNHIISFSGGLDSTSLLLSVINKQNKVICVNFDYGQNHKVETELAKKQVEFLNSKGFNVEYRIIDAKGIFKGFESSLLKKGKKSNGKEYDLENMSCTVVPSRNIIFASIIWGIALSESKKSKTPLTASLAVHSGDHEVYPDCRPQSLMPLKQSLLSSDYNEYKCEIMFPFISMNKTEILSNLKFHCGINELDFNDVVKNTISSYDADENGVSSGRSATDIERIKAFMELGLVDPIPYENGWEKAVEYVNNLK